MRRPRRLRRAGLALLGLAACDAPTEPPASGPRQTAAEYLETALTLAETESLRRHHIDWDQLRQEARVRAEGALEVTDVHAAVRYVVAALGDGHSAFVPAAQLDGAVEPGSVRAARPREGVASLTLAGGVGGGSRRAAAVQRALAGVDGPGVCGWIVDLRTHRGGDLWPDLAGLEPLLGPGPHGQFVDADGARRAWWAESGAAGLAGDGLLVRVAPYPTRSRHPVAVLLGPETASGGEALALALGSRPGVRTFGQPTAGLTTANRGFYLSDGALLVLTVAHLADATGESVQGSLLPDETVERLEDAEGAALHWLRSRGC